MVRSSSFHSNSVLTFCNIAVSSKKQFEWYKQWKGYQQCIVRCFLHLWWHFFVFLCLFLSFSSVTCHLEGVKFFFQCGFSWSYLQKSWMKVVLGSLCPLEWLFHSVLELGRSFEQCLISKRQRSLTEKSVDESEIQGKGRDDSQSYRFFTCTLGLCLKGGHYLVFKGKAVLVFANFLLFKTWIKYKKWTDELLLFQAMQLNQFQNVTLLPFQRKIRWASAQIVLFIWSIFFLYFFNNW